MKVNFAHVCDYASISREGKLSAMGIFSQISAAQAPAVHPILYLAFELSLQAGELGRKFQIEIRLTTEDGKPIIRAETEGEAAHAPGTPAPVFPVKVPQVLAFGGVLFPSFGTYSFYIFVNGDLKATAAFDVVKLPERLPAGGQA